MALARLGVGAVQVVAQGLEVEPAGLSPSLLAHSRRSYWVSEQHPDRFGQLIGVTDVDQKAGPSALDQILGSATACGDHRSSERHGLQDRQPESLRMGGVDEKLGMREERRGIGDLPGQQDPGLETKSRDSPAQLLSVGRIIVASAKNEDDVRELSGQLACGIHQIEQALPPLDAAKGDDQPPVDGNTQSCRYFGSRCRRTRPRLSQVEAVWNKPARRVRFVASGLVGHGTRDAWHDIGKCRDGLEDASQFAEKRGRKAPVEKAPTVPDVRQSTPGSGERSL